MIIALMLLINSPDPTGFESYISQLGVPKTSVDEQRMNSRSFDYRRDTLPMRIDANCSEIPDKQKGFEGFINVKKTSANTSNWENLPRRLPSGMVLGFDMMIFRSPNSTMIKAFANHSYIDVKVSGLLVKGEERGEVVKVDPAPTNTEEVAGNIATLFLAEQEAYHFTHGQAHVNGTAVSTLIGLDETIYYSLSAYSSAVSAEFTLHPHTGAGVIQTNPPITFNLASRTYKVGGAQRTAEHIVVLKNGIAYIPAEMLEP